VSPECEELNLKMRVIHTRFFSEQCDAPDCVHSNPAMLPSLSSTKGIHRHPPASIVHTRMEYMPQRGERVKLLAPQHSSGTWFASVLCASFAKPLCFADHLPCTKLVKTSLCTGGRGVDCVVKKTILPSPEITLRMWLGYNATYRILMVRDPLAQQASIAKERWRENCGGMLKKLAGYNALVHRAVTRPGDFDAIIFSEEVFHNQRVLQERIGLPPPLWWSLPPRPPTQQRAQNRPRVINESRRICRVAPFLCKLYGHAYDI